MTVRKESVALDLVGQALALLIVDQAVQLLPMTLLPAHPGMGIFQQGGRVTNQLQQELSTRALREIERIGGELNVSHRPYLLALAGLFEKGTLTRGFAGVPKDHPLWKEEWEGLAFFAPDPPSVAVLGRLQDYRPQDSAPPRNT